MTSPQAGDHLGEVAVCFEPLGQEVQWADTAIFDRSRFHEFAAILESSGKMGKARIGKINDEGRSPNDERPIQLVRTTNQDSWRSCDDKFTRREALSDGRGAAAGVSRRLLRASVRLAQAIEPIKRSGLAKFKFSLAGYSYRDLFKPNNKFSKKRSRCTTSSATAPRCSSTGTEPTSYYFPTPVTSEYLTDLRRHCFRLGLDISGTAVGNDFCHPDGPERKKQIASVKQWIDHAAVFGHPSSASFPAASSGSRPKRRLIGWPWPGSKSAVNTPASHAIHLALENHGGLTATPAGLLALVKDVQSPWFGVNLDSGNFHGEDVYAELAQIAPYTVNVQIKVVVAPAGQRRQPSDFKRLAKILRDSGYRGYVVLEYEETDEDPRTACPKYIDRFARRSVRPVNCGLLDSRRRSYVAFIPLDRSSGAVNAVSICGIVRNADGEHIDAVDHHWRSNRESLVGWRSLCVDQGRHGGLRLWIAQGNRGGRTAPGRRGGGQVLRRGQACRDCGLRKTNDDKRGWQAGIAEGR